MDRSDPPFDDPTPWTADAPLDRVPGESWHANRALRDYYSMGYGRTVKGLYQYYTQRAADDPSFTPPTRSLSTLKRWAALWDWAPRAFTADAIAEAREEQERQWQRRQWRKMRVELLAAFFEKVADAVRSLDVSEANLAQVSSAIKVVAEQLRAEFDDLPALRVGISLDQLIGALPAELRQEVMAQLEVLVGPEGQEEQT